MAAVLRVVEIIAALAAGVYLIVAIVAIIARLRNRSKFLLMLVLLAIPIAESSAQEARCTELGAACICHRSLAASSWTSAGGGFYYEADQNLSDPKICRYVDGVTEAKVYSEFAAPQTTTGLNGYGAMLDVAEDQDFFVVEPNSAQWDALVGKRIAARYYLQYGGSYNSSGGGCTNDKYSQIGAYFTAAGTYTSSNGGGFTPSKATSDYLNKWIRIELVMDKFASFDVDGWTATYTVYLKNVTDNDPEISFSFQDTGKQGASSLANFTNVIHRYRATSNCTGQTKMMYAMLAAWTYGGSERIGAASELEGGGSPALVVMFIEWAPVIIGVAWHFRSAIISASVFALAYAGQSAGKVRQLTRQAATVSLQRTNRLLERRKAKKEND